MPQIGSTRGKLSDRIHPCWPHEALSSATTASHHPCRINTNPSPPVAASGVSYQLSTPTGPHTAPSLAGSQAVCCDRVWSKPCSLTRCTAVVCYMSTSAASTHQAVAGTNIFHVYRSRRRGCTEEREPLDNGYKLTESRLPTASYYSSIYCFLFLNDLMFRGKIIIISPIKFTRAVVSYFFYMITHTPSIWNSCVFPTLCFLYASLSYFFVFFLHFYSPSYPLQSRPLHKTIVVFSTFSFYFPSRSKQETKTKGQIFPSALTNCHKHIDNFRMCFHKNNFILYWTDGVTSNSMPSPLPLPIGKGLGWNFMKWHIALFVLLFLSALPLWKKKSEDYGI